ncbi:MAG: GGDEF domain-containing protein [Gammaproteobacteria bacterium]|nr:GGDEF domain-containing protein [Gammaproteobacteria bacterium]
MPEKQLNVDGASGAVKNVFYSRLTHKYDFARYIIYLAIVMMPLLAYFDYKNEYYVAGSIKLSLVALCILVLIFIRRIPKHFIVLFAVLSAFLMSLIGGVSKLDSEFGIVWLPVLPLLYLFLSNVTLGTILVVVHYVVISYVYFSYAEHGIEGVEQRVWIQASVAYVLSAFISVAYESSQAKLQNELIHEAEYDYLTNIYNRRGMSRVLQDDMAYARRYKDPLSFILLDIDNFKTINDRYGHETGDVLLTELGRVLKGNVRVVDHVSRWGGEEFLISMPNTSLKQAQIMAEKLRHTLSQHAFEHVGNITASFGITSLEADDELADCIKRADMALYKAKDAGKNQLYTVTKEQVVNIV